MDIILIPGLWLDGSSWDAGRSRLEQAGHRAHADHVARHGVEGRRPFRGHPARPRRGGGRGDRAVDLAHGRARRPLRRRAIAHAASTPGPTGSPASSTSAASRRAMVTHRDGFRRRTVRSRCRTGRFSRTRTRRSRRRSARRRSGPRVPVARAVATRGPQRCPTNAATTCPSPSSRPVHERDAAGWFDAGRGPVAGELDADHGRIVDAALSEARDALFHHGQVNVSWADALVEVAQRSSDQARALRSRNC